LEESGAGKDLTGSATMMGSPRYMSPEQMISAKDVDARTDVWALGVILYELVSGQPVWNADTVQGLCAMIATAPAPSLRVLVPSAPELLDDVIQRCLAKDPAQRVPSIADLATLLAPLASAPAQTSIDRILRVAGRSRSVPIPRPPPVLSTGPRPRVASNASMPALSQTPATPSRLVSLPPPAGNGRAVIGLGVVIALIGIGAGGMLYLNRGAPPPPAAPAAAVASLPPSVPPPPLPAPSLVEAAPVVSVSASATASTSAAPPKRVKHMKSAATASAGQPADVPPSLSLSPPSVVVPPPAPAPEPDRAMTDRK
jgi:serine/threonine-protein kinase